LAVAQKSNNILVKGLRLSGRHSSWRSSLVDIAQYIILFGALIWVLVQGANSMGYNWQWYRVPRYIYRVIDGELIWGPLVLGAIATLKIAAWSLLLSIAVGLAVALLRLSDLIVGQAVAKIYLEIIRNTPILVQLYLFYYVLGPILGFDRYWAGVVCLGVFEAAFASEIFRAGILSVPRGQWEASASIGLSAFNTYRYIVLPQAIRLMLPPLASLAITLIKHSAIVSVIAVNELTTSGRNIISDTFMSFEIWFTVAAIYLVITISLSLFVTYLEHRFRVQE